MKRKKQSEILCLLLVLAMLLAGCGKKEEAPTVQTQPEEKSAAPVVEAAGHGEEPTPINGAIDFAALGRREYVYPSEFAMGADLQAAITQLALCYESFDSQTAATEEWKEIFINRFLQNSRMTFGYLEQCAEEHQGVIGADELNYIQYSLTGVEAELSAKGPVNILESASPMNYGWITDWRCEEAGEKVTLTASLALGYGALREDGLEERELTVQLVRNPYSCFDGYSVVSLSARITVPWTPETPSNE